MSTQPSTAAAGADLFVRERVRQLLLLQAQQRRRVGQRRVRLDPAAVVRVHRLQSQVAEPEDAAERGGQRVDVARAQADVCQRRQHLLKVGRVVDAVDVLAMLARQGARIGALALVCVGEPAREPQQGVRAEAHELNARMHPVPAAACPGRRLTTQPLLERYAKSVGLAGSRSAARRALSLVPRTSW